MKPGQKSQAILWEKRKHMAASSGIKAGLCQQTENMNFFASINPSREIGRVHNDR